MAVAKMRARRRSKCPQCPWSIKRNQWAYLYVVGDTKVWVHAPCYFRLVDGKEEPRFDTTPVSAMIDRAQLASLTEAPPAAPPAGVVSPEGFRGVLAK